jgi:predicted SprT family Zn-dependent metalloprotease
MPQSNPTTRTYHGLSDAYDFFNTRLFGGTLPRCLITMQRKNKTYGYFARDRFGTRDGEEITDEIALNPSHFRARTTEQSLSTLAHEMVHLWQHHFGEKKSRAGYHNKEWADKMEAIGLEPSDTSLPGGKRTGQRVSHYIRDGGPFHRACTELVKLGFIMPYVEMWGDDEARKTRKKKAASKTKYTCPGCGLNAWAKPDLSLRCGACELELLAEESAEEN